MPKHLTKEQRALKLVCVLVLVRLAFIALVALPIAIMAHDLCLALWSNLSLTLGSIGQ
jgi:hypothetical protein